VKIRGLRIELGEIENRLQSHESIKEAVVIVRESGEDQYLCAYVVPTRETKIDTPELRQYLSRMLPDYMIPSYFVTLEKIPVTLNGKVNRKALPEPTGQRQGMKVPYAAPEAEKEKIIAQLWQEILQVDKIGIYDNFFELGGNSINLIQLTRKLQDAFQQEIPMVKMFMYPTISSLVDYLNREEGKEKNALDEKTIAEHKESAAVIDETMALMDNLMDEIEEKEEI
jgi:acyl carrier protein